MIDPAASLETPDWGPRGLRMKLREVLAEAEELGLNVAVVLESDPGGTPFHPEPSLLDSEVVGNRDDTPPRQHILAGGTVNVVIVPIRGKRQPLSD